MYCSLVLWVSFMLFPKILIRVNKTNRTSFACITSLVEPDTAISFAWEKIENPNIWWRYEDFNASRELKSIQCLCLQNTWIQDDCVTQYLSKLNSAQSSSDIHHAVTLQCCKLSLFIPSTSVRCQTIPRFQAHSSTVLERKLGYTWTNSPDAYCSISLFSCAMLHMCI